MLKHIAPLLMIALVAAIGQAQEPQRRVDLINVPHYLTPSGVAAPLDREKPVGKTTGFLSSKLLLELKGEHAKLRLTPEQATAFYATFSNVDDPENLLLYRLEIKKGKREATIFTASTSLLSLTPKIRFDRPGLLPHDTIKIGDTSFKLVPGAKLPPGEYLFFSDKQRVLVQMNDAFTFGVE